VIIHTVLISYQRLHLTQQAVASYLETVTVPYSLWIVDNGSDEEVTDWIIGNANNFRYILLGKNRYPGYACNRGWERAADNATVLHRADNDFRFLPGWCEQVALAFQGKKIGQVGLRTADEDGHAKWNTGGNCAIRRELWDQGLRYDERPWPQLRQEIGPGHTEDSLLSPAVKAMGYKWTRVAQPCITNLASGDWHDDYYVNSYGIRGIRPRHDDPTVPADWTGGYS